MLDSSPEGLRKRAAPSFGSPPVRGPLTDACHPPSTELSARPTNISYKSLGSARKRASESPNRLFLESLSLLSWSVVLARPAASFATYNYASAYISCIPDLACC